ncbi:MAG: YicC family protein [Victivallaceae bacterium]|nr:YicC family protein [Victivallaceae bacterium]
MRSMTGFGKAYAANAELGIAFSVEISSVNRKQLEIRANLPHEISAFELLLQQIIKQKISRGTVMARVSMNLDDREKLKSFRINRALLEKLADECREQQTRMNDRASWSVSELMNIPGVLENVPPDMEKNEIKVLFAETVEAAAEKLVAMRETEGRQLCDDLKERCGELTSLIDALVPLAADVPEQLRRKLLERLKNENLPVDANDERMLKELIFYVDRSDVSEELTRLRSHFAQFEQFLESDGEAVGRGMDFLLQEMFREITTLGNKASGSEVTPIIVKFKTELEKIREQVQNIE